MPNSMPIADNIIRDDFTTDKLRGGPRNDHLIHHRDSSVQSHDSTGLVGFAGDDILEASIPNTGQVHMFGATGNDWMILDVTKVPNAGGTQGHHVYGGHGNNTFQFTNIEQNFSPILGRLDDFDPTSDRILIENQEIDLTDLPLSVQLPGGGVIEVRVVEIEHPEFIHEELGTQYFLAIGDNIFYALEGARDLSNGTSGRTGEERHFLRPEALDTLRNAETVDYVNPKNYVPQDFYKHREDELTLNWAPRGAEVHAETGGNDAVQMFGGKGNHDSHSSSGSQVMHGSDGDDVINGATGNDTIYGGDGNDLIAGGIDNDVIYGGAGDDMIWGGDGNDSLFGGKGDDYLHGGRGDDYLDGGEGNDTLVGASGNNTLIGGGGDDAVNRFHFFNDGSNDVIMDFKVGADLITLQDNIDPLSVEIYENEDGHTVINYGHDASVLLQGVSLREFQDAAEARAEEGEPIISITPDPEEELLRDLRVEIGFFGEEEAPSLMMDGVQYGNDPFIAAGAGGYTYIAGFHDDDCHDFHCDHEFMHEHEHGHEHEHEHEQEDENEGEEDENQRGGDGSCFVATAAYRDPWHPDVVFLRAFRDQWLAHRAWGRAFIAFYWQVGPILAGPVRRDRRLARPSKALIGGIVRILRKVWV